MRVLIFVPETAYAENFHQTFDKALPENRYAADYATDEADIRQMLKLYEYDAVMIAVDGRASKIALNSLRNLAKNVQMPLLAITHDMPPEKIPTVWEAGAASVIPVESSDHLPLILPQAVNNLSLLRAGKSRVIETGAFVYDMSTNIITYNHQEIPFSVQEYELMTLMLKNEGRNLTKERLYNHLYSLDPDAEVDPKIVDVYIHKVRAKLKAIDPAAESCIETVWGVGYRFHGATSQKINNQIKNFGGLTVDYTDLTVSWQNKPIPLSITEYLILKTVAFAYPAPVPRKMLLAAANQYGREGDIDTLKNSIAAISRKLRAEAPELDGFMKVLDDKSVTFNLLRIDPKLAVTRERDIEVLGAFKNNFSLQEIMYQGKVLSLTPKQYELLSFMIASYPAVVTREQMAVALYGDKRKDSSVAPLLTTLQKVLNDAAPNEALVTNRRGIGYVLNVDERRLSKKFIEATQNMQIEKGPWKIDTARWTADYKGDSGTFSLTLPKAQFEVLKNIAVSYPSSYAPEGTDTAAYYQLKVSLDEQSPNAGDMLRKLDNGHIRLDLTPEEIPADILAQTIKIEAGPWEHNTTLDRIFFDGDPIALAGQQARVMEHLIATYPAPQSAEALLKVMETESRTSLNTALTQLRKKMADDYNITMDWLTSMRGVGYVLNVSRDELSQEKISSFTNSDLGGVILNHEFRELEHGGRITALNKLEYHIVDTLLKAEGPLNFMQLYEALFDQDVLYEEGTVRTTLSTVMDKFNDIGVNKADILTNGQTGYYLNCKKQEFIDKAPVLEVGSLKLNLTFMTLTHTVINSHTHEYTVALSPSEFALMQAVMKTPRELVMLSDINLEAGREFSESTLPIAKLHIQEKLREAGDPTPVILVGKKSGYCLAAMSDQVDTSKADKSVGRGLPTSFNAGNLHINTFERKAYYNGQVLEHISGHFFDLLVVMSQEHGEALKSEEIAQRLLGDKSPAACKRVEMGLVGLKRLMGKSEEGLGEKLVISFKGASHAICAQDGSLSTLQARGLKILTLG